MRKVGPEWGTGRNGAKKEDPHMHAGEFNERTHSSGGRWGSQGAMLLLPT